MKNLVVLLLLCMLINKIQAQGTTPLSLEDQNKLIAQVSHISDPAAKLKAIDSLISSGKLTSDGQIATIYSGRAQTLWAVFQERVDLDNSEDLEVAKQKTIENVLADYKKAIDACAFCQPAHRQERAEFLKDADLENNPLYDADMKYVKDHGFKETESGFVIGFNYMGGKSGWFGAMISPFGYFDPRYKITNTDPADGKLKTVSSNPVPTSVNYLTIEYNQNLDQPAAHEMSFSPFQMTSPFLINPAKFGFTQSYTITKPSWFYRPELGIGWGYISVAYAYNFVFSKSDRHELDTNMLIVRFTYPIVPYKSTLY